MHDSEVRLLTAQPEILKTAREYLKTVWGRTEDDLQRVVFELDQIRLVMKDGQNFSFSIRS